MHPALSAWFPNLSASLLILGIITGILGALFPRQVWILFESWKFIGQAEPSPIYLLLARLLSLLGIAYSVFRLLQI